MKYKIFVNGFQNKFLLNKINYLCLHWFIIKKSMWSNKEKGCGFELSNIVVAADLFVVVVAAAAEVVPVVVAVGKDM